MAMTMRRFNAAVARSRPSAVHPSGRLRGGATRVRIHANTRTQAHARGSIGQPEALSAWISPRSAVFPGHGRCLRGRAGGIARPHHDFNGLTPPASAPRLSSSRAHICAGTGLAYARFAPALGSPPPASAPGQGSPPPASPPGLGSPPPASAPGLGSPPPASAPGHAVVPCSEMGGPVPSRPIAGLGSRDQIESQCGGERPRLQAAAVSESGRERVCARIKAGHAELAASPHEGAGGEARRRFPNLKPARSSQTH
jgi:hypothetical protein